MSEVRQAAVIIGSYNQAPTLKLLLTSLNRQTEMDFEVIVADDGSSDETQSLCVQPLEYTVQFVTQEDLGFRKSRILNRAIRLTQADYLIFVDGDTILEKHFIEDHLRLRRHGHFVCGRRVDLGPVQSKLITPEDIMSGKFDRMKFQTLWSRMRGDTFEIKRGFRITQSWLRKLLGYDRQIDVLGSNFSVWKSDLLAINGFNEEFTSYWGEDGDVYIRLRNSGKRAIGAKSLCVQYHIFHPRRPFTQEAVQKHQELLSNRDYKWAPRGYSESEET